MAGDIGQAFDVMFAGVIIIILMGYGSLRILKQEKKIKYIVWASIWGTMCSIGLFTYFLYREYYKVNLMLRLISIRLLVCCVYREKINTTAEETEP
jgi:hypothetical protein